MAMEIYNKHTCKTSELKIPYIYIRSHFGSSHLDSSTRKSSHLSVAQEHLFKHSDGTCAIPGHMCGNMCDIMCATDHHAKDKEEEAGAGR